MSKVKHANWFLFAVVCIYLGGSIAIGLINRKIEIPYNLLVMSGQILIGATLAGYAILTKGRVFKEIKHERLGIVDILLIVLTMFLCLPIVYFINIVSMNFTENEIADTMMDIINNPYILNLLMVAVTPAIVEELVCRGVLYHSYKSKSTIFAVIMSSFIFGLLHMNLNQMLYAIALGVIFCIVVEATGSIYASMIMHFIMNSISTTMMALLKVLFKLGGVPEDMLTESIKMQGVSSSAATMEVPVAASVVLVLIGLLIVAAFGMCAALVIVYLARRRGHYEDLKAVFKKQSKEDIAEKKQDFICYIKEYIVLVIAVIICIVFMTI